MTRSITIELEAEEDLEKAKQWYDNQRLGLGSEFLLCVDEVLEFIRQAPESPAVIFKGVRRVPVRRFPYGIFYLVEDERIVVIAAYHARRDPRGWKTRV